jgi:Rrf2 family protein
MAPINTRFSVGLHVVAALGYHYAGGGMTSDQIAQSVNADPSSVRRVLSGLAKAGIVTSRRGHRGACRLSRDPVHISLLEVYRACEPPAAVAVHDYPAVADCPVSSNIKGSLAFVLGRAQASFDDSLARTSVAHLVDDIRDRGA